MKYKVPAVFSLAVFLFSALPCRAQHGGGGHSMGHSMGHSIGHSLGHIFGAHSSRGGKGTASGKPVRGEPPLAGAAMIHGRVVQLPRPGRPVSQPNRFHRPLTVFGFNRPAFFGFGLGFGFGFCALDSGFDTFGFPNADFDCLQQDLFFDPFLAGGIPSPDENGGSDEVPDASAPAADDEAYQNVILEDQPPVPVDKVPHHRRSSREPDTLLQLNDGSMYGLRDYWVLDGRLHYVTNYGGENAIPLSRINFEKTNQLNADRGIRFSVQAGSPAN